MKPPEPPEPPSSPAAHHTRLRDLTRSEWLGSLKSSVAAIFSEHLTDRAAALTYYAVLSFFPGMIVLVSLLGLLGDERTIDTMLRIVGDVGADSVVDTVERAGTQVIDRSGTATVAFILGLIGALWAASGYVNAFTRAGNGMYRVEETRPIWHVRPRVFALTIVLLLAVTSFLFAIVLTGPVAEAIANEFGLDRALDWFGGVRWPLLIAGACAVLMLLYRMTPNVPRPPLAWNLPGALLATVLWLVASAAFSFYVANFANYGSTYGALAGVVVFLIWMWITNVIIVLGARFTVELRRVTGELPRPGPDR